MELDRGYESDWHTAQLPGVCTPDAGARRGANYQHCLAQQLCLVPRGCVVCCEQSRCCGVDAFAGSGMVATRRAGECYCTGRISHGVESAVAGLNATRTGVADAHATGAFWTCGGGSRGGRVSRFGCGFICNWRDIAGGRRLFGFRRESVEERDHAAE